MTESDQQAWQRSPIGITMPSVNPRPGSTRVQKIDMVGAPRPGISDKFQVLVPGLNHKGGLGAQLGASAVSSRVCSVCTRASADYSCPRCLIGYCSSKCYKAHGSQCTEAFFREHVERETRIEEDGEGRVGGRERREGMMQLLRRVRESDKARQDVDYEKFSENRVANILNSDVAENEPVEAEEHARLARERLEALSLALNARDSDPSSILSPDEPTAQAPAVRSDAVRNSKLGGKNRRPTAVHSIIERQGGLSGSDDGRVLDLLTEEEKKLFLREVASGRLGRLIVPWMPWWTQGCNVQEIHSGSLHPAALSTFSDDSNSTASLNAQSPTPEEHQPIEGFHYAAPHGGIRREEGKHKGFVDYSEASADDTDDKVERKNNREGCSRHTFSVLSHLANQAPRFSTLSAKPPSPSLQALATDLAYAYVYTARLYNGCWCSDPVGASLALIGVSPVLRDGATPSTVEQAMSASVRRAVEGEGLGFRLYAESLRKDVVALSSDHRKWLCAFEDAWGMLDAAVRTIESSETADLGVRKKYRRRAAKELCKAEKRVGYFRSWALSHGERVSPAIAAAIAVSTSKIDARASLREED